MVAQIFRRMPSQLKATAATPDAVIRWDIGRRKGTKTDTWYLVFKDGSCRTTRRHGGDSPRTTIAVGALDFVRLASGAEQPMAMFQAGRLKISGDIFFAAQLQSAFAIPA